jgi:hypothetical protein
MIASDLRLIVHHELVVPAFAAIAEVTWHDYGAERNVRTRSAGGAQQGGPPDAARRRRAARRDGLDALEAARGLSLARWVGHGLAAATRAALARRQLLDL